MRTKEIAALVDEPYNSVAQLLYKMKHQGKIRQPKLRLLRVHRA